ncbi:MAG: right-handed parallel beta-helix repeat-containing protein [Balneolaceae bacterium]|nr:right-handed parallel beta-helix repeat-containing protein [Balneolaceae bacterium]
MSSSRKSFIKSMALGAGTAMGVPLAFGDKNNTATGRSTSAETGFKPVLNVKEFGAGGMGETDDSEAIQAALDTSRERNLEIVYVPEGIYHISDILIIYENTTLHLDRNAVIIRKADINAMLINGTENVPGYDGQSNITVEGGTWDGNSREFPSNVTPLGFGHARNITVQNLTVLDVYNWHHLEINAIDGATIRGCFFEGMILTRAFTEMIQIDLMGTEGMFPWFGEFDNTTCRNVLIDRCTFKNGNTAGIGTHSTRKDALHEYITISNCEFINLEREGIVGQNWQHVHIENNFLKNCNQGILMEAKSETDCEDISIINNRMVKTDYPEPGEGIRILSEENGSQIRHIQVRGNYLSGVENHGIRIDFCDHAVVQGNTVKECDLSGILSYYSDNISIIENSAFGNGKRDTSEKDIRINTPEKRYGTGSHIISTNNTETCRVDAADSCLITKNVFKSELTTESEPGTVQAFNNFIGGTFSGME